MLRMANDLLSRRMLLAAGASAAWAQGGRVTKYVRYRAGNRIAHGILDGDQIRELKGDFFSNQGETGKKVAMKDVKLLYPTEASKILALGLNYRSHAGDRVNVGNPELFFKPPTSLQNPGDPIVLPPTSTDVHFECELVIVIGKRASRVSVEQAKDVIFGVTCGNDVSERQWQNGPKKDLQWWRAKGSDTFAPCGPVIARGLDYGNLKIQTRLNGKVMQEDSTHSLVHGCEKSVSFISQFVTLLPGDLIYTGTPGKTTKMSAGDTVEVEIEGIGILQNKVVAG